MRDELHSRLKELEQGASSVDVLGFYDSLPATSLDQMIGSWRGAGLATGHALDGLLEQFGWHGKRFDSTEDAHPLVFGDEEGKLFSIDPSRLPMGLLMNHVEVARSNAAAGFFRVSSGLFTTTKPHARLRMTEYRGVVSASMIYDDLPINDVFRAVDSDTLLGAMDMRGFEQPFMFTLRREAPASLTTPP